MGFLQSFLIEVGGQQVDLAKSIEAEVIGEKKRQGVGLFSGGTSGAPDGEGESEAAFVEELAERSEVLGMAEKPGFSGHQLVVEVPPFSLGRGTGIPEEVEVALERIQVLVTPSSLDQSEDVRPLVLFKLETNGVLDELKKLFFPIA